MKNSKINTLHRWRLWFAIPLVTALGLAAAITATAQPSRSSQGGAGGHPMMGGMMQGGMMQGGMMQGGMMQNGVMQTNSMMSGQMGGNMMQGNMMARCYEMATMDQMLQARMQTQNAKLQQLVTKIKQAPKAKRTALMENIVTKMVKQQTAMNEHVANMHMRMMRLMRDQIRMDMMSGKGNYFEESMRGAPPPKVAKTKAEQIKQGRQVFEFTCAQCHRPNGQGLPNVFPPLAGSSYLNANKDAAIRTVIFGRHGQIVVDGRKFNNTMPRLPLTDRQIANVLTFVYNSFGNSGFRVTPAEVKALRAKGPLPSTGPASANLFE